MKLSPEAYDAALLQLGEFIRQKHFAAPFREQDELASALLFKADCLDFLRLADELGFTYLLSEVEVITPVENTYRLDLPITIRRPFSEVLADLQNYPENAMAEFDDFTAAGLWVKDVWHERQQQSKTWAGYTITEPFRKSTGSES